MNPILQLLSRPTQQQFNSNGQDAKAKVMAIVDNMNPAQRANFSKMLPVIERIARNKGVDTSALSELQARM